MDETTATDRLTSPGAALSLSVVVPVFNSANTLGILVQAIDRTLADIEKELILVNDGSRDRSWEVICDLSVEYSWIRGINLMRNYGQHNALLCGIRAAHNKIIVTMDDDLQNPPDEVPKLLTRLSEGYDVVYGTPLKESHGLMRDLASRITKVALQNAMGAETAKNVSAFRVFRSNLRVAFERYSGPYVSIDVLLTWSTQRFSAIPVENRPRSGGVSGYTTQEADYTCNEHAHWIQHLTLTDQQPSWIHTDAVWGCDFGRGHHPLSPLRWSCPRIFISSVYYLDLFGGTTVRSWNLRRIPGSRAYSDDG